MNRSQYEGVEAIAPPKYLQDFMLARGGTNPYGEPNYRLVRALARKRLSGGKWHEWPKSYTQAERNGDYNRPTRTWVGVKPISMYPGETGWVLERWFPPEAYGSQARWYAPVEMGGTLKKIDGIEVLGCGEYPERGDYEGTNYYLPNDALTEATLGLIIGGIETNLSAIPSNPAQRLVEEMARAEEEEVAKEKEYQAWAEDQLGQAQQETPDLDARTPGGQAEFHRLAESIGIRSQAF